MPETTLDQLDQYSIGHTIQLGGGIWTGEGKVLLVPFPDEPLEGEISTLTLSKDEYERFLNQSDVMDIRGPGKAILRKSQRQIDSWMSWQVFERDNYTCRYCGYKSPLTVDHIILWEQGGATVPDNLMSSCRKCNKDRGSMEYQDWLNSPAYHRRCSHLLASVFRANLLVLDDLPRLRTLTQKGRSR